MLKEFLMSTNILKELREGHQLSQEGLARRVGVQRATISMIERGVNKPSVQLAKRLSNVLKCEWTIFFDQ